MNSIKPWLRFFRLPNLPTAPGDALAGAALALAAFPELFAEGTPAAVAAGAASFFFYLFGLADNDVAGAASDAQLAPERPIPRGEISLRAAKAARAASLAAALLAGAAARLPPAWWCVAALLAAAVLAYNRVKGAWLMGACRGLSLVAGGAALCRAGLFRRPDWSIPGDPGTMFAVFWTSLLLAALGWTLYIAAVTLLSEGEERESEGLGNRRYLFGLAAFAPLAALVPAVALRMALPDPRITPTFLLFPLSGARLARCCTSRSASCSLRRKGRSWRLRPSHGARRARYGASRRTSAARDRGEARGAPGGEKGAERRAVAGRNGAAVFAKAGD